MGLLNRDAILAAQDLTTETVEVPEWGGSVLVSTLSGVDRDAWDQSLVSVVGNKTRANLDNIRARLVALTVVDEAGNKLFKPEDAAALGKKSAAALMRVFVAAQRLNGMGSYAVEDAKGN